MNPLLEKLLIGAFFFAVYWFVLRKYNSLGLRMFFLFTTVSSAGAYWIYEDEQTLKSLTAHGENYTATLLEKERRKSPSGSSPDNWVKVSFQRNDGQMLTRSTAEYVSVEEFDRFQLNKPLPVLYDSATDKVFVKESLNRFKDDKWILYMAIGVFFLIGVLVGIFTRNYKVGVHEDTGDEYLTKDGKVVIDEKTSTFARTTKRLNMASKFFQIFGKN